MLIVADVWEWEQTGKVSEQLTASKQENNTLKEEVCGG